jgi:hypothetical protein
MSVAYFHKPTEEEVSNRHAELKKKGGSMLYMDDLRKFSRKILTEKNKTDIAFSWIKHYHDFSVFNKEEMTAQMKQWKNLAKKGKLTIYEENNKEYDVEGKTIYCLVITPAGGATTGFCPLALAFGTMVDGYTYAYTKKDNRDAIYAYIKKNCVV